jgi:type II secretory pathway pseudopilin PulG
MSMRRAARQRGMALLALLAVIMLGASWFLVSRLNLDSNLLAAANRSRNAEVLNRAKQALIGYIAAQAAKAGENRPGAFPCPEAPGNFNDAANEGSVSYPCTPPIVGRFPWRTLGLDKLVDVSGEPLWYAVASGWAGASTVINSNCASYDAASTQACRSGRLSVDGVVGDVVALIIAPGPAISVPTSANCTAWTQTRPTTAPPDWRNYLECENATTPADATFATTGPGGSFNDQIVTITAAEIIPAVEAAIAHRIEREIVPALATVYTPASWGFGGSNEIYPYPAGFASPGPGTGTSSYQGAAGTYSGLLPFNQTQGCTVSATDPRCTTSFLVFSKSGSDAQTAGGGSIRTQSSCAWVSSVYVCTGQYNAPSISYVFQASITNVAMGLRVFDPTKVTCTAVDDVGAGLPTQTVPCSSSIALQPDGSVLLTVNAGPTPDIDASGWGTYANYMVNIDRSAFGDHGLLSTTDPGTCPSYGCTAWFARNEWFRLLYYAAAPSNTAARLPLERSCTTAADCLSVANPSPTSKRMVLVLAGRALNGGARPSAALTDYFEFGNANAAYEIRTVTARPPGFHTDTGGVNAYSLAITSLSTGSTLHFKAANANTGTSTLYTAATGTRSLVNEDGSNLAAGTILANATVQVTWDGTQFVLSRRPFNDRVVAAGSN